MKRTRSMSMLLSPAPFMSNTMHMRFLGWTNRYRRRERERNERPHLRLGKCGTKRKHLTCISKENAIQRWSLRAFLLSFLCLLILSITTLWPFLSKPWFNAISDLHSASSMSSNFMSVQNNKQTQVQTPLKCYLKQYPYHLFQMFFSMPKIPPFNTHIKRNSVKLSELTETQWANRNSVT